MITFKTVVFLTELRRRWRNSERELERRVRGKRRASLPSPRESSLSARVFPLRASLLSRAPLKLALFSRLTVTELLNKN